MAGNLGTTNLLLGIMAAVSVLEALVVIGLGVAAFMVYRRVMDLVNGLEAVENATSGHVIVATHLEIAGAAEYATITVSDNGPGFARDVLGRAFDPYVTSKPKGTGLGLAIVKKIVEEHGGRVEADNRPEGGARVRVSLPVTDGSRQLVARERRSEPRKERA